MAVAVKIEFSEDEQQLVVDPSEAKLGGADGRHRIFWKNTGEEPVKIVFDNPAEWSEVFASTYPTSGTIRLAGKGLGRRARKSATYAVKTKKQGRRAVTIEYTASVMIDGEPYTSICSIKSRA